MRKSFHLLRLAAATLLLAWGGCSENNDPEIEGGGNEKLPEKVPVTYTIALGETSEKGASVKVTSSDDKATYYCGIHTEASLLGIPDQTLLKQLAALENLSDRLHTGAGEFTITEKLVPVTSYKIVVADYDGKEFTGALAMSEPFAVEPPAAPAAFAFELKEISYNKATIDIVPVAAEVPYFAEVKEVTTCDAMTDDAIIAEILNLYGSMASWFTYTGPQTISSDTDFGELIPDTEYYVLAFGYADGAAATELNKFKFKTDPEGDPKANSFTFEATGITARTASVKVTPSVKSVRYVWDVITDANYKKYDGNIRNYLVDYIQSEISPTFPTPEDVIAIIGVRGDEEHDYDHLTPATTYYLWAVCVDASGNPTAEPAVSTPFTTHEAVLSKATATVEFDKYYDGSQLYAIDNTKYKNYNNKAYLPAKIVHSAEAVKWYTLFTGTDVSDTSIYTDEILLRNLISQGSVGNEERFFALPWNELSYFIAVAEDADGNYGPIFRKGLTPDPANVSPISDLGFEVPSAKQQSAPIVLHAAPLRNR